MTAKTFNILWDSLKKKAENAIGDNSELFIFCNDCKEELFDEYSLLRDEFKHRYMLDSEKIIDRHKVAAIFMLALLSIRPVVSLQPHEFYSNQADWMLSKRQIHLTF
jgi:hypothetical protein